MSHDYSPMSHDHASVCVLCFFYSEEEDDLLLAESHPSFTNGDQM